ncbi:MAG: riboflavin synthase [Candidatus Omnitrophica bacterium]|nr:riboflavin synthase [Candidatus Omnitrophota bacterium]
MFTGIVEKQGKLVRKERQKKQFQLTFEIRPWEKPLKRGESVSVNGVCLTVTKIQNPKHFTVQAVPETLAQTTLGSLRLREAVNLERSLKWGDRMGGHFVLGHVDGTGRILSRKSHGKSYALEIEASPNVLPHLVEKGSVAIDGVSFTVQKMAGHSFTVAVISHTAKTTTIGRRKRGDRVNLEADVIAKHLAQMVQSREMRLAL